MLMPQAPGYWMFEKTGVLRPAVEAYLNSNDPMSPEHVAAMRAYIRQWIAADWRSDGNELELLRAEVDTIKDRASLTAWLDRAMELEIDPL